MDIKVDYVGGFDTPASIETVYGILADVPGSENRRPSILNSEKVDEMILEMDRSAGLISTWPVKHRC